MIVTAWLPTGSQAWFANIPITAAGTRPDAKLVQPLWEWFQPRPS